MTYLLATCAADVLLALLLVSILIVIHFLILIILGLVLAELATGLIFADLAAAPPHLTAIITLMLATGPVEVLFIRVLLAAIFASLEATIKLSFPLDELLDS